MWDDGREGEEQYVGGVVCQKGYPLANGARVRLCDGSPCCGDDLRKVMGNGMLPGCIRGIFGKGLQRQGGLKRRGIFIGAAAVTCVSRLGDKGLAPGVGQNCHNTCE